MPNFNQFNPPDIAKNKQKTDLLFARVSSQDVADSEAAKDRLLAGLPGAEVVLAISRASAHLFLAIRHCSRRISLPSFSASAIISVKCSGGRGGLAIRNCWALLSPASRASWAHSYALSWSKQHLDVSSRYSRLSSRREPNPRRCCFKDLASSRSPLELAASARSLPLSRCLCNRKWRNLDSYVFLDYWFFSFVFMSLYHVVCDHRRPIHQIQCHDNRVSNFYEVTATEGHSIQCHNSRSQDLLSHRNVPLRSHKWQCTFSMM